VSQDERKKGALGWRGCMGARSHVKLHQVLDQLTGWVTVVYYIRGRYEMCD
jgi:hypothetical protein